MLELAPSKIGFLTVTRTKDLLDVVRKRAIAHWGEKNWRAELARATVTVLQQMGDTDATYETRRRQLYRVFETESCTTDTLLALVEAVGCRLQLVCTEIKIIDP
ncbi:MAG: hypothetical protein HC866_27180 [Leptolyngbyaceae cyanobacterium RU_5_1]|nr:hypothetical protein [Leptolyngbyaceae cyanobacterium RU_5_1]